MAEQESPAMFQTKGPERSGFSPAAIAIAAGVILLAAAIAIFAGLGRRAPAPPTTPDFYAGKLPLSQIALSEATNGAGGRSTFVDGLVTNTGTEIVRGILVRATFAMSDGSPPYAEVLPLSLIRTREPYIDLQTVSASPIRPGEGREFRLIFESLPAGWDVQAPELVVVQTSR